MSKLRLSDIAQAAGVSTATVSNALNRRAGVSEELAESIRRMASEMGYPIEERGERGCLRFIIYKKHGKVVTDTPFFAQLIEGVQGECQRLSYDLLVNHVHASEDVAPLMNMPSILLGTEMDERDLRQFKEARHPFIMLDSDFTHEAIDSVSIDNIEAGHKAACHLMAMGHREIGFLGSSLDFNNMRDRFAGFREALWESGLTPVANVPLEPTLEGACRDMSDWLTQKPKLPTAFFAGNDILAVGASRALKQHGVRLPDEVSIMGMDDMPMCQVVEPQLTTIRVDKRALGVIAVDRLKNMLDSPAEVVQKTRMGVSLVIRSSVRRMDK